MISLTGKTGNGGIIPPYLGGSPISDENPKPDPVSGDARNESFASFIAKRSHFNREMSSSTTFEVSND